MSADTQARPRVALIVPAEAVTIAVLIPEPLASDLRRAYERIMDIRAAARFKVEDFDAWIVERLKDFQYGPGIDAGDLEDREKGVRPLG